MKINVGLAIVPLICLYFGSASAEVDTKEAYTQSKNGEFLFKHYPKRALEAGEQGSVGFRVTVTDKGELTSCEVTGSSGFPSLDKETCDLIVANAHFKPAETADGKRVSVTHNGVVNWRIPEEDRKQATLAAPKPVTSTQRADLEKIICRSQTKTGSLIKQDKVCLTKREWIRMTQEAQERTRSFQGEGHADEAMVMGSTGG